MLAGVNQDILVKKMEMEANEGRGNGTETQWEIKRLERAANKKRKGGLRKHTENGSASHLGSGRGLMNYLIVYPHHPPNPSPLQPVVSLQHQIGWCKRARGPQTQEAQCKQQALTSRQSRPCMCVFRDQSFHWMCSQMKTELHTRKTWSRLIHWTTHQVRADVGLLKTKSGFAYQPAVLRHFKRRQYFMVSVPASEY